MLISAATGAPATAPAPLLLSLSEFEDKVISAFLADKDVPIKSWSALEKEHPDWSHKGGTGEYACLTVGVLLELTFQAKNEYKAALAAAATTQATTQEPVGEKYQTMKTLPLAKQIEDGRLTLAKMIAKDIEVYGEFIKLPDTKDKDGKTIPGKMMRSEQGGKADAGTLSAGDKAAHDSMLKKVVGDDRVSLHTHMLRQHSCAAPIKSVAHSLFVCVCSSTSSALWRRCRCLRRINGRRSPKI